MSRVRQKREAAGLSMSEVARRAKMLNMARGD
jgi:transcriptional regulator with XRE-family HTH domain